jgi:serine/threonine-protein kinase
MRPNAIDLGSALLAEYTLEEKLSATVFRARRRRDGRELAVRVVRPSTPLLAAEFLALAESASRVRHPMLANVEAYGRTADDACYIASEFVRGQKLDEWADEIGIPPLAQVIELVRRLCIGLQAAARSGVAHDGLNPRNIHVLGVTKGSGTRTPMKLLDLGVPALLFEHSSDPQAVRFMAPEQLQVWMRPEPPATFRCSETMNVYSCGSLLYFLATGGPPHPGSAPSELLASQAAGRLAPPVRINPQISPGLNAVVLRALAIDPGERFASVAELGEALAQVAGSIPAPARASRQPSSPTLPPVIVTDPPEPTIEHEHQTDGPPTFRTSRLAEQSEAELLRADDGEPVTPNPLASNEVSTLPPPAAEPEVHDSISGVAPIGLFSSAPPFDERRGSSFPPPDGPLSSRPPLALFSEPPPPAAGIAAPAPYAAAPEPKADRNSVTPGSTELELLHERRPANRAWLMRVALPLAAVASALAFFVVRGFMSPAEPASSAAISGSEPQPPADTTTTTLARAPAPPPAPTPPVNEEREPAPAPGATLVPSPQQEPAPAPESSARKHEREHEREHERHRSSPRSSGAHNSESSSKAEAEKPDDAVQVSKAPPPAPADAIEPPAVDAAVARAKPAALAPPPKPAPPPMAANDRANNPPAPRAPSPPVNKPSPPARAPLLRAKVTSTLVNLRGSLPKSPVRRAIEKLNPQFASCYARSAQLAGQDGFGDLIVDVEIDESGRARNAHARGGTLSQLDACVADAASKLNSDRTPDTGTVTATWKVTFSP